jgi:hypothetical protein
VRDARENEEEIYHITEPVPDPKSSKPVGRKFGSLCLI